MQIYDFFLRKKFSADDFVFLQTKMSQTNNLHIVFVAVALIFLTAISAGAQGVGVLGWTSAPDSTLIVAADTTNLTVAVDTTAGSAGQGDLLRAKVDSLRAALRPRERSAAELAARADSLRLRYDFASSVDLYSRALKASTDSLESISIEEAMVLAQNGLSMTSYASRPTVVSRKRYSIEDFFLHYPLQDGAWRATPNVLDSLGGSFARATFVPEGASEVYYSAPDASGTRNIYHTEWQDSLWSVPQLVNEQVTTSSDEIYPMLSQDGKSLYFASKGLYGMGGYDLYVSQWDRKAGDWGAPVNLGFPYSSPYDDFLYANSDDGLHTLFASNRECSRDSVIVYVLEYDSMPLRKSLDDPQELRRLASLVPGGAPVEEVEASESTQTADMTRYSEQMGVVRALRDSLYNFNAALDDMRASLPDVPVDEQSTYIASIVEREQELPEMQKELDEAVAALREIEMEFLLSGVVIDPAALQSSEPSPVENAYVFVSRELGDPLEMVLATPEPAFDYTFRILPEGQLADGDIPSGLVYQIQFASSVKRLPVEELKGMSPVFEKMSVSLRYTYTVGVFRTYADVLSHLNEVKRLGYKTAFIVTWQDGRSIPVADARALER